MWSGVRACAAGWRPPARTGCGIMRPRPCWPKCRAVPYLYSEADIAALMTAARSLAPAIRAATYETLIGLLSVTGMRIGEVIRLDRDDIDWDQGVLTVRDSKFGRSREIPVHPSALAALRAYAQRRDRLCPQPRTAACFISPAGARLVYTTVQPTFSRIAGNARVGPRPPLRRARLHDLRHAVACPRLPRCDRDRADVHADLPLLSPYLAPRT